MQLISFFLRSKLRAGLWSLLLQQIGGFSDHSLQFRVHKPAFHHRQREPKWGLLIPLGGYLYIVRTVQINGYTSTFREPPSYHDDLASSSYGHPIALLLSSGDEMVVMAMKIASGG